jgi:hypothetical protein
MGDAFCRRHVSALGRGRKIEINMRLGKRRCSQSG